MKTKIMLLTGALLITQIVVVSAAQEKEIKPITAHVGDIINIPFGMVPTPDQPYRYEVANKDEVYFGFNPEGATNILAPGTAPGFFSSDAGYDGFIIHEPKPNTWQGVAGAQLFQRVKAIKPGTVTIKYNRVPSLCTIHLRNIDNKDVANKGVMVEGDFNICGIISSKKVENESEARERHQKILECDKACKKLEAKQTMKDYKSVTITVLPVE